MAGKGPLGLMRMELGNPGGEAGTSYPPGGRGLVLSSHGSGMRQGPTLPHTLPHTLHLFASALKFKCVNRKLVFR